MSTTHFSQASYVLSGVLDRIEMGEIGLPDIQRPFVWKNTKVRDLFDSMYRGFPVGYLLFWANGSEGGNRQVGSDKKQMASRLLIVDGQQRLTSLYAVLKGKPVIREKRGEERIQIAFRPKDDTFAVADAAVRRDPEYIEDISQLWSDGKGQHAFITTFIDRLVSHREVAEEEQKRVAEAITRLYNLVNYPFTVFELSNRLEAEEAAEVFVRINSKGTPLKQADFILTLMSVFWDDGRMALERFCRAARQPPTSGPSPFNYLVQPGPDHLLRVGAAVGFRRARLQHVYSILRGKDLKTGQFSDESRKRQFAVMREWQERVLDLQNWHEFLKAIIRAGYRRSSIISSNIGLLYAYAFYLIGKQDYAVEPHVLRDVIARWFFMTSLTGRYSGSYESIMEEDLARVGDARDAHGFVEALDRQVRNTFTKDYWTITLPGDLATAASRTPGLFAYYASLGLLDARVLFSKMRVSDLLDPAHRAKKAALERHHLFAKKYLARLGIKKRREVNQIANLALVEWPDNIAISDKAPSEYFPAYMARLSSEEQERMVYWHALPERWERMPYEEFLPARRQMMAQVIRDGFAQLAR